MRPGIALGCLTAVVSLVCAPGGGAAQTIPSPYRFIETKYEAGPLAGVTSAARGQFGLGPSGGPTVGGRWGVGFGGLVGFETVATLMKGTRDVIDPARAEGNQKVGEAQTLLGVADARLRFTLTGNRTWHGVAPFFVMGGGIAIDLAGEEPEDLLLVEQDRFHFNSSFLGTVGVGSSFFLSERLALRGDAIFSLWKLSTPRGFSDPLRGFDPVDESEWVSASHYGVSLLFLF